jgi:spore coat protein JC
MWDYKKNLIYPVNIKNKNPQLAKFVLAQYGGPDGELGASLRYLSQRFSMPDSVTKGLLNDVGLSFTILHLYKKIGKAY